MFGVIWGLFKILSRKCISRVIYSPSKKTHPPKKHKKGMHRLYNLFPDTPMMKIQHIVNLDTDASYPYHLSNKHKQKYGNIYYGEITLGGINKKMMINAHRSQPRMNDCDVFTFDWSKNGVDMHSTLHKDRQYSLDWSSYGIPSMMDMAEFKPQGYRFPVDLVLDWSMDGKPQMPNYWHNCGYKIHYLQLVKNPKRKLSKERLSEIVDDITGFDWSMRGIPQQCDLNKRGMMEEMDPYQMCCHWSQCDGDVFYDCLEPCPRIPARPSVSFIGDHDDDGNQDDDYWALDELFTSKPPTAGIRVSPADGGRIRPGVFDMVNLNIDGKYDLSTELIYEMNW